MNAKKMLRHAMDTVWDQNQRRLKGEDPKVLEAEKNLEHIRSIVSLFPDKDSTLVRRAIENFNSEVPKSMRIVLDVSDKRLYVAIDKTATSYLKNRNWIFLTMLSKAIANQYRIALKESFEKRNQKPA